MFSRLVLGLLLLVLGLPAAGLAATPDTRPVGVWPLRPPVVVTGFDPPADPWGSGHRGVDLLGEPGEPVHSAMAGRIFFVGRIAGRGVVVVDHGETRTTYEPVTGAPARGTRVGAGEVIGRLETPGSHCAPRTCLHWGWLRGEVYLDPLLLVGAGPVRLLPLAGLPSRAAVAPPSSPKVGWPTAVPHPGAGPAGSCWVHAQARGWACW